MTSFGISLLRVRPSLWLDVAREAEHLGFDSVWMSDHLVLPTHLEGYPDGDLPINPSTPVFDVFTYLAAIAATTSTLRLGTFVYLLALRHPFVAARAAATLDIVSGGRLELGIGVGWSRDEWTAAGLPFAGRGRRFDESIDICRRLWTEPAVAHHGEFYHFAEVAFEPKPVQTPLPLLIGGESDAALRRTVERGNGWIGMHHTPASVGPVLHRLSEAASGRAVPTTVGAPPGAVDVAGWRQSGVDRVIVAPWQHSGEAIEGMRTFASRHLR